MIKVKHALQSEFSENMFVIRNNSSRHMYIKSDFVVLKVNTECFGKKINKILGSQHLEPSSSRQKVQQLYLTLDIHT